MSRLEEVEAELHSNQLHEFADELARTLAAEVDARDEVIGRLLEMLEPGRGVFGTHVDDKTVSLSVADWQLMERLHARACEIAGRTE